MISFLPKIEKVKDCPSLEINWRACVVPGPCHVVHGYVNILEGILAKELRVSFQSKIE